MLSGTTSIQILNKQPILQRATVKRSCDVHFGENVKSLSRRNAPWSTHRAIGKYTKLVKNKMLALDSLHCLFYAFAILPAAAPIQILDPWISSAKRYSEVQQ